MQRSPAIWILIAIGGAAIALSATLGTLALLFPEVETGSWEIQAGGRGNSFEARSVCVRTKPQFIVAFQLRLYSDGLEVARLTPFAGVDSLAECRGDTFAIRSIELADTGRSLRVQFGSGVREWPVLMYGEDEP